VQWKRGPGFWRSFLAICIPLLLSALEGNTALPTISDALELGTSLSVCTTLEANTSITAWLMFQLIAASGFGIVSSAMLPTV
jgi:hypothetical protein